MYKLPVSAAFEQTKVGGQMATHLVFIALVRLTAWRSASAPRRRGIIDADFLASKLTCHFLTHGFLLDHNFAGLAGGLLQFDLLP